MAEKQVFTCNDLPKRCFQFFKKIERESTLCDVTIHSSDKSIPAHRVILGAAIPYFRDLFFSNSGEKSENIHMQDIEPYALKCLIEYAYRCEINIDANNVKDLLSTACFLSVDEVKEACCDFLCDDLKPENAWNTRKLAIDLECKKLLANVDCYIMENFNDISQTKDFLDFPLAYLKQLLEKDDLKVVNEQQVFDAILRWVKAFPEEREEELSELLYKIRMPLLEPLYLANIVQTEEIIRTSIWCRDIIDEGRLYHLRKENGCRFKTQPRTKQSQSLAKIENPFIYVLRASERYYFQSFNLLDQTWETKECKMYDKDSGSAVSFQNEIYFFQGCITLKYDPHDNTYQRKLSMPTHRELFGAAVLKEKIYVCGGETETGDTSNAVECFYPGHNEWAIASSMLSIRCALNAVALDEYIFTLGGRDCDIVFNTVERYDPELDKWTFMSPMLIARWAAGAASLNGRIYVCGGHMCDTAEMYNPIENKWVFISPLNSARFSFTLLSCQGKLYAIRGVDGDCEDLDFMDVYDPENEKWTCIPVMIDGYSSSAVVMEAVDI